jgi:hypothetical protein
MSEEFADALATGELSRRRLSHVAFRASFFVEPTVPLREVLARQALVIAAKFPRP